jgi:hypothetical protein
MMVITVVSLQESNFTLCFNILNVKFIKIKFKNSVPTSLTTDCTRWPTVAQTPTHNTGIQLP